MNAGAWVLMALTHINGGSTASFQEFGDQKACDTAAAALVQMATTAGDAIRVKCTPQSGVRY